MSKLNDERLKALHAAAGGVFTVEVLDLGFIVFHPLWAHMVSAVSQWAQDLPKRKPLCLTCDHSWTSYAQEPPTTFVFVSPWRPDTVPEHWLACAVCEACAQRGNLQARVMKALEPVIPGARIINAPHAEYHE